MAHVIFSLAFRGPIFSSCQDILFHKVSLNKAASNEGTIYLCFYGYLIMITQLFTCHFLCDYKLLDVNVT